MELRKASAIFALALAAGAARAGVEVGDPAPPIETTGLANTTLRSLDALKGKVVLYEFFAFW